MSSKKFYGTEKQIKIQKYLSKFPDARASEIRSKLKVSKNCVYDTLKLSGRFKEKMSSLDRKVRSYVRYHPKLSIEQVAINLGYPISCIKEVLKSFPINPTELQLTIIDIASKNVELSYKKIADMVKCNIRTVSLTVTMYLPDKPRAPKRSSIHIAVDNDEDEENYVLKPCLGLGCNEMHKSTGKGDRFCPNCRKSRHPDIDSYHIAQQYIYS